MAQRDDQAILRKLERTIDTQEVLRGDVSNLKERMSALEMMLGTQMIQIGQMQLRMDRLEVAALGSRRPHDESDSLPELH